MFFFFKKHYFYTDESEFIPARHARDGTEWKPGYIPNGFYLVADSAEPQGPSSFVSLYIFWTKFCFCKNNKRTIITIGRVSEGSKCP